MKENYIHVCFIVDKSGSMYDAASDVVGGFKSIIAEQRQVKDGQCSVSLYTFDDNVVEHYIGKDVFEVEDFVYVPSGCTAMNDGIGTAIDNIGKWLSETPEEERPSKNLIRFFEGLSSSGVSESHFPMLSIAVPIPSFIAVHPLGTYTKSSTSKTSFPI